MESVYRERPQSIFIRFLIIILILVPPVLIIVLITNCSRETIKEESGYQITYDANGGNCEVSFELIKPGGSNEGLRCYHEDYSVANYTISRGACAGFFDSETGICSDIQENMTIRVNWGIKTHVVVYDANDGVCEKTQEEINYGDSSNDPLCQREGYVLIAYTIEAGNCVGEFNIETGVCDYITADIKIKANWEVIEEKVIPPTDPIVKTYTVTYNAHGGSCSPSNRKINQGRTANAPICTRTGYNLLGFTRTHGSGGSLNTSTGAVTNVTGNQTIRANWGIKTYTVTYNAHGGSCSPSNRKVNHGSTANAPLCTRTGYNLVGFTRTHGGGGSLNITTGAIKDVTGNQTIRANWVGAPVGTLSFSSSTYNSITLNYSHKYTPGGVRIYIGESNLSSHSYQDSHVSQVTFGSHYNLEPCTTYPFYMYYPARGEMLLATTQGTTQCP